MYGGMPSAASSSNDNFSSYVTRGGSSSFNPSSTFDKQKYKNAKGIGSDMLNDADRASDPSERMAAQSRIAEFSGSTAISSDAVRALNSKFSFKYLNNDGDAQ